MQNDGCVKLCNIVYDFFSFWVYCHPFLSVKNRNWTNKKHLIKICLLCKILFNQLQCSSSSDNMKNKWISILLAVLFSGKLLLFQIFFDLGSIKNCSQNFRMIVTLRKSNKIKSMRKGLDIFANNIVIKRHWYFWSI